MKLNLRFLEIHTDIKLWRGTIAGLVSLAIFIFFGALTSYSVGHPIGLTLFLTLVCGAYLGIVLFQTEHKPKTTPEAVKGDYWLFVKDPSRVGVYGPYSKAEAKSQVVDFNESYPFNHKAAYVKAKSREEAQVAARELRKS